MNILYTAVVLDDESRNSLMQEFGWVLPPGEGASWYCHHVTLEHSPAALPVRPVRAPDIHCLRRAAAEAQPHLHAAGHPRMHARPAPRIATAFVKFRIPHNVLFRVYIVHCTI